ncbi:MAG TPA: hypothetical protein VJM15_04345 [Sphingomicrobium sp.]|nr:hypothetical protein [Sphingomicrobium sp.]
MMSLPMSAAGSALLRALVARAAVRRDRILLIEFRSTEWQSLTFIGERHEICLRVLGPQSGCAAERLTQGLANAEFAIPGHIVADIAVADTPAPADDGSMTVRLEALTIAD